MTCTIEVAANGESLSGAGVPARLLVYGRITSGDCDRVRFRVRLSAGGPVLFAGEAETDSNGTWSRTFPLIAVPIACGTPLHVEAECIAGGACTVARTVRVACKRSPAAGGGGEGDAPGGGGHGGSSDAGEGGPSHDDWPWPWPPPIFCPAIGRVFTVTLLVGVLALLVGIALGNGAVIAGALGVVAAAFAALLGVWVWFCRPHGCYVAGAILWVAKRATIAALILLIAFPGLPILGALWITGCAAGLLTGRLRRLRCPIPRLRTPISQLPVW